MKSTPVHHAPKPQQPAHHAAPERGHLELFAKHLASRRESLAGRRHGTSAAMRDSDQPYVIVTSQPDQHDDDQPRQHSQPQDEEDNDHPIASPAGGAWQAAAQLAGTQAAADAIGERIAQLQAVGGAFELMLPGARKISVRMDQMGHGCMVSLACSDPAHGEHLRAAQQRLGQLLSERLQRPVRVVVSLAAEGEEADLGLV